MISWDETVQNMAIVPTSTETPTTKASLPRRIASKFIFADVWPKWIDLFISTKNNWLDREKENTDCLSIVSHHACHSKDIVSFERKEFYDRRSTHILRWDYFIVWLLWAVQGQSTWTKKWWRIKTKRSIEHKHAHTWGSNFPSSSPFSSTSSLSPSSPSFVPICSQSRTTFTCCADEWSSVGIGI